MRDADRREILCQLPPGTSGSDAAAACFFSTPAGFRFTASIDGQPVAAFGIGPSTFVVYGAWAFGTQRMKRAIPAMNFHIWHDLVPRCIKAGCRRVEVRSLKDHDLAHLWISRMGGIRIPGDLPDHGRDGEVFTLWAWTLSDFQRDHHVLQSAKTTEDPRARHDQPR